MRNDVYRLRKLKKEIGANICQAREEADVTLQELADFIGITPKRLSDVEAGYSHLTHFNMAICAHKLGIPIAKLYGDLPTGLLDEIEREAQRQRGGQRDRQRRPTVDVNLNGIQIKLDL